MQKKFMALAHCLQPEIAHQLGLKALHYGLLPRSHYTPPASLAVRMCGLSFPNPVGLAAGFDKNAFAVDGLLAQGFGFVEAGTVTPLPQPGNPKPRIFRLAEDEAVINRLGFNNEGLESFVPNLKRRRAKGIVGANIGKNKDSSDAVADYVRGLEAVYPHADYVTVNISSPNTSGLRALQKREALNELLTALRAARDLAVASTQIRKPLFLKVAPDLELNEREDITELAITHGIDALIVSNTTISRPDTLRSPFRDQTGGLSGKPLSALSTEILADFYRLAQGRIALIGAGGIASAEDAYAKIRAGAALVQFYTALVYQGFSLVPRIQQGLVQLMERDGLRHIGEAVGAGNK